MHFNLTEINSIEGKTAIVTGSNTGIGFETAKGLASKNIHVIMACRNLQKAEKAKNLILKEFPSAKLSVMLLDLSDLHSIELFASTFLEKFEQLDILVNNAGVMVPPFSKTKDGFELQTGANYLGHFHLTNLLFPVLKKTPEARIITLSSIAHKNGKIDFENFNAELSYSKMGHYGQSKLACLMFALELDKNIKEAGLKLFSIPVHPGVSPTELMRNMPGLLIALFKPLAPLFSHDAAHAALPSLMAALHPDIKSGEYYGPTGFNEMKGKPGKAIVAGRAKKQDISKQLWSLSEKLTGKKFVVMC